MIETNDCFVYAVICDTTGERYTGVTTTPQGRYYYHLSRLRNGNHPNDRLQALYDLHGEDCFSLGIIADNVTEAQAIEITNDDIDKHVVNPTRHKGAPIVENQVTWNGITYPTIAAAAEACKVTTPTMSWRYAQGYTSDDDMPRRSYNAPIHWNGEIYETIEQAAVALNITYAGMVYRINQGYTCDDDVKKTGFYKPMVWGGVKYESIKAAADDNSYSYQVMRFFYHAGFTCEADAIAAGYDK